MAQPGRCGRRAGQSIAMAVDQMVAARLDCRRRQQRGRLLDGAIRTLDLLLEDLERMNLDRKRRIPPSWQSRLDEVRRALPASMSSELKVGVSPMRLLGEVYDLQERLFELKAGQRLPALREADDQVEAEAALQV